jgi:hypothetical protein
MGFREASDTSMHADGTRKDWDLAGSMSTGGKHRIPLFDSGEDALSEVVSENLYLRLELAKSEAEREELSRRNEAMEKVLAEGKQVDEQEMNTRLNQRNRELQGRLQRLDYLRPFLSLEEDQRVPLDRSSLNAEFLRLRQSFGSLLNTTAVQYSDVTDEQHGSRNLDSLLLRIWGKRDGRILESVGNIRQRNPRITQALMGAAVCEWVFHTETLIATPMDTLQFQKYRDIIETACKYIPSATPCLY